MSEDKILWSSEHGDLRKKSKQTKTSKTVQVDSLQLCVQRLRAGKGRIVLRITGLPENDQWNKDTAKFLKQKMAAGGTFKSDYIEINSDDISKLTGLLDGLKLKWKKIGG